MATEDNKLRKRHFKTKSLVISSLIGIVPTLALAGGQIAIIANRANQYGNLRTHGVTVSAVITDCPTQVFHDNSTGSNTDNTTCNATFYLRGNVEQEAILGVGSAVATPQKTTLVVDPSNPAIDYLASDVRNGNGTGVGSFFTSILGIFALIWTLLWLYFAVPAWRRRWRRTV